MSSDTVACTVRLPSATSCSSFISRRIAAWFCSFVRFASCSSRSACARCISASAARLRVSSSSTFTIAKADSSTARANTPMMKKFSRRVVCSLL